ncbi:Alpha-ketoglutarate-dependent xanthine dioxygenase xanA [Psilocybe cubensis]|uniref:Alpha-ketoglutarate-dependent xanthine dioxygenase xanA n=2 Tax=Psilocybe cubensis TaxID=181762 RepID=A0ACB8HEV4_PSICU|nr:Alpha-ketoglutarate-dependent xanthine dioxygenase xanA [Psilocybe cubensis]KAH9486192.1 Alpha-ketoglutarate-dependent xanthine dioxygenase xanA [Psilocybe cubensis]
MPLSFVPLTFPSSLDSTKFKDFGREVVGAAPGNLTEEEFKAVEAALYRHDLLLFRNASLTPDQQYSLVKSFDPQSEHYGHGNKQLDKTKQSIIHSYVSSLPNTPQVQIIGHGTIKNHEGIEERILKHGRHPEFHKTRISEEDEAKGFTRFFRWHMDAALYDLNVPKVTALYGIMVPKGPTQTVRYDDGTGDELSVSLGTTAFVSGKVMFEILPAELKSLAVRARAKYAPHPFQWLRNAKAKSTGISLETEGLETPLHDLPPWEEEKIKVYPFTWKNPITGDLHLQVHPLLVMEIQVDPLPQGHHTESALYPFGGTISNLKEIRDLLYRMQRPGIAPNLVYAHPWEERDLVLFNNRGLMHSVVGVSLGP